MTVTFLFYNLLEGAATSDAAVLFQGIVNPPDQSTESLFQLSAVNWMNMQRRAAASGPDPTAVPLAVSVQCHSRGRKR